MAGVRVPATQRAGAAVAGSVRAVLPSAKLYRPIWEYDARTLAKDLSVHLVYGAATSATFATVARSRSTR